jgi:hypothetical protein
LGYVWPEPDASAAGHRALKLIELLERAGHETIFASGRGPSEGDRALGTSGARVVPILGNDSSFDRWISETEPDAVLFDRFLTEEKYGARVREACPGAARILDTVDLHFLRRARERAVSRGIDPGEIHAASPGLFEPLEECEDLLRELASIHRSDLSLLCSEFELELLVGRYSVPRESCLHFPLCYSDRELAEGDGDSPPFADRAGFGMIGNFRHSPNSDGVRWFAREIWPLIRAELPGAQARIHGAYPRKEMTELSDPRSGLHVLGPAPTARGALSGIRVSLAPLRFGAGQKGKITDSWLAGTPVVTTPIGSEGMTAGSATSPVFGGTIAGDVRSFARAAVSLHEDQAAWEAAVLAGRGLLRASHADSAHAPALVARIERTVAALGELRSRNVIGAMLAHHQHASTKYFSRWIEAKNLQRQES